MDVFSAHQAFAMNLYNTFALANEGRNFLMSPLSIFAALSMVLPGAKQGTLQQMLEAMRLDPSAPLENTEAALGKMLAAARGTGDSAVQLFLANKAYIQRSFEVRQQYLTDLRNHFGADVVRADFARDPEGEKNHINDWVAAVTKGKIAKLLESVDTDTRLILVNALYFKANWSSQFQPELTSPQPFETSKTAAPVSVPMMHQTSYLPVIDVPDLVTAVRFPFKDSESLTSLFAILPAKRHGLDALLTGLSPQDWLRFINTPAQTRRVKVALPKVRLSRRTELSDRRFLPSLGIRDLFSHAADLSGMGIGGLSVSSVVHQAVLELDELGAEGAAATAVVTVVSSMGNFDLTIPREIKFDQPFMLVIAKEVSDVGKAGAAQLVPIFMGRVSDPREA